MTKNVERSDPNSLHAFHSTTLKTFPKLGILQNVKGRIEPPCGEILKVT
jgi:hypothetical protein